MTRAALTLAGLLLLSACQPLYLPAVPAGTAAPVRRPLLDVELRLAGGRPVLFLEVISATEEGWLALQWFSPRNTEVASDSVWLAGDAEGLALTVPLPADIDATPGEWRLLLSLHSRVLRQLSVNVP